MRLRRPLLWALLVSGALHVVWLTDLDWEWPFAKESEDEVIARQKAKAVKRVRLAINGKPAEPGIPTVTLLAPESATAGGEDSSARPAPDKSAQPKPKDKTAAAKPEPVTPPSAPATGETAEAPPSSAPAASKHEPAPSFPVAVLAMHRATYQGFRLDLKQQWLMEGFNYLIRNDARKFGFTAMLSSEGKVSPEGLQPEHYRLLLNNQLKQYADFDRASGMLTHGKAGSAKTTPLTSDFQDMASLPYHVAVSYEGESERTLKVTTGSSVYDIVLRLESEETLKLPGGSLRTLHLTGSRTRSDGTRQVGYDIWLAPGYRNFPVKFRGPDSKGNILEMAVLSLTFDGKRVFGRDAPAEPASAEPETLPEDVMREHDIPAPEAVPAPAPVEGVPAPDAGGETDASAAP